jgi:hypothetical protein
MNGDNPAFPIAPPADPTDGQRVQEWWSTGHGLTKREEFAKAAMQGMMADNTVKLGTDSHYTVAAQQCVRMADTLLEELSK